MTYYQWVLGFLVHVHVLPVVPSTCTTSGCWGAYYQWVLGVLDDVILGGAGGPR